LSLIRPVREPAAVEDIRAPRRSRLDVPQLEWRAII